MTKAAQQTVARSIRRSRDQIALLREKLEDLNDYLDVMEARARDQVRPRLTHQQIKRRYRLR